MSKIKELAIFYLLSLICTSCLVYIVIWLTAVSDWMISMGWLV
jgi:hypothetical protein